MSTTPAPRLDIAPYDVAAALALERELGVSRALAQVLVRRGHDTPARARAWMAAGDAHPADAFDGIEAAVALVRQHVERGSSIVVHGDYDVDGVCSTAVLVRCLRRLGADPGWHLPHRGEDGYGLAAHTVERLHARGCGLLITVDCAITAVEEVAAARAMGIDVLVTDHHTPRADGRLPDAPIVHPRTSDYPCPDLCATGVAYKLALALEAAIDAPGRGEGDGADDDLDLVALATIADVVPLTGENRRLARAGLRALATTRRPGLRALMAVAGADPSGLDATTVGFRLAPRLNAAGRLGRADAALELLLTGDGDRARVVAEELDRTNARRRDVETRIRFEAEAQVREAGERASYVLVGEDWHPGVVGIVAARIAERHHRPAVLIALPAGAATGTGSARSIPAYDVLAGITAAGNELERFGGHRAAAGVEVARNRVDAFRAALEAHAAATLTPEDLQPVERIDAVVGPDELGIELADELERIGPFGAGNPPVRLLVRAGTLTDARAVGDGRHLTLSLDGGGARARVIAFGAGRGAPPPLDRPIDASVRLERDEWNGIVSPQVVLGHARECVPGRIEVVGEPESPLDAALVELSRSLEPPPPGGAGSDVRRTVVDRRDCGLAGTLAALAASGEQVLVVCADVQRRLAGLRDRLGGFALCSYAALETAPGAVAAARRVVALDPPAHAWQRELLERGPGVVHLAWGEPEVAFTRAAHAFELDVEPAARALYRAAREERRCNRAALARLLAPGGPTGPSAARAGRALRVLTELGLVTLDLDGMALDVPAARRTELERSPAFRAYRQRLQDGDRYLNSATPLAA